MARFLLIHGAYHGAWCWRQVVPLLQQTGHAATAVDLPCHGDDQSSVETTTTDSYVEAILAALPEPTILVGHSMAGVLIAAAAERAPELVKQLIFISAYAPTSGTSVMAMRRAAPWYDFGDAVVESSDGRLTSVDMTIGSELLYHDCPPHDVNFARARLRPEPTGPLRTPVELTGRYGAVAKAYIRCTKDRVLAPEYQKAMTVGWPSGSVIDLDSGHSPFFAAPIALVRCLLEQMVGPSRADRIQARR